MAFVYCKLVMMASGESGVGVANLEVDKRGVGFCSVASDTL
jgi:hypothetical protein